MRVLIILSTIVLSLSSLNSQEYLIELGLRTYEDARRVLLQQGEREPVFDASAQITQKGVTIWVLSGINLGLGQPNPNANYFQSQISYEQKIGSLSIKPGFSLFLGGEGDRYLEVDLSNRLLIPNIKLDYGLSNGNSIGLWLNYFDSPAGSASMIRTDYTMNGDFGMLRYALAYSSGPFGSDWGINHGLQFTSMPLSKQKFLGGTIHASFNFYQNLITGANPFTVNTFGGGIVLRFSG